MKYIAVFFLTLGLLFSGTAFSKEPEKLVARSPNGATVITLYDLPCTGKVADMIGPDMNPEVKKATVVTSKASLEACFMVTPNMTVAVITENGDIGELSIDEFKHEDEV